MSDHKNNNTVTDEDIVLPLPEPMTSRKKLSPWEEEFERNRLYFEALAFCQRIPPGIEQRQHAASCNLFKIGLNRVPTCTCGKSSAEPPK